MNRIKKIITFTCLASVSILGRADIIVLKDGNTMSVHNIEIGGKWLYYTEKPDTESATQKIGLDKVFAYKIGEGELTVLSKGDETPKGKEGSTDNNNTSNAARQLEAIPADDNVSLIASYNNHPELVHNSKKAQPDKYSTTFLSLWGIEDGSILSDANVEIGFEQDHYDLNGKRRVAGNRIKVTNKTDAPIYIDLASSFKILNGGYAQPYYSNSSFTEGKSASRGASMNLGAVAGAMGIGGVVGTLMGGMSVGGANTNTASITKNEQQILVIPPHSSMLLPGEKVSNGSKIIECYEPFLFNNQDPQARLNSLGMSRVVMEKMGTAVYTMIQDGENQQVKDNESLTSTSLGIGRWHQTSFTPENSPKKIGRVITYSTSPDFKTYTSLPVKLYMRGAFGVKVMVVGDDLFTEEWYDVIKDKSHYIVGDGRIKK